MEREFKPDGGFVQGLARGLAVIRAFDGAKPAMTLSEIAEICGVNRAAVRRSLMTLETLGYVASDGRLFRLTPRILDLGFGYLSSQGIGQRIQPLLRQVSAETGEACALGMLDGTEIVCVAHSPGAQKVLTVGLTVGSRMPLLGTAIGRIYLAYLDEAERARLAAEAPGTRHTPKTVTDPARLAKAIAGARAQGYAVVDEEYELGVRSIAVAVVGDDGRPLAALNVVASAATVPVTALTDRMLPVLRRTATSIVSLLG